MSYIFKPKGQPLQNEKVSEIKKVKDKRIRIFPLARSGAYKFIQERLIEVEVSGNSYSKTKDIGRVRFTEPLLRSSEALIDTQAQKIVYLEAKIKLLEAQIKRQTIEVKSLKTEKIENRELVESIKAGRKTKDNLIRDMVQGAEFGKLLGVSRQSINTQRNQGKLIAVGDKNGNYYPTWQITENHKVYGVIPAVIKEIGYDDDWGHVLFFLSANELLNGSTPLSLLHEKSKEKIILNAAKIYNQHIAL